MVHVLAHSWIARCFFNATPYALWRCHHQNVIPELSTACPHMPSLTHGRKGHRCDPLPRPCWKHFHFYVAFILLRYLYCTERRFPLDYLVPRRRGYTRKRDGLNFRWNGVEIWQMAAGTFAHQWRCPLWEVSFRPTETRGFQPCREQHSLPQ